VSGLGNLRACKKKKKNTQLERAAEMKVPPGVGQLGLGFQ